MTIASNPVLQNHPHAQRDGERQTVACLIKAVAQAGVRADPIAIVNFYVALKSKPLAILTGPAQSGKIALVQSLAQVLTGGDPLRCQMMVGHAWWARASREVALFTEAQTRFNTDKILALIEEAWKPENVNRVFLACLTRISPAELMGFFSEVAFQLRHGQIMRLPTAHLSEPIPYPSNLFLVGTMDKTRLDELADPPPCVPGTAMIYLANAWSWRGAGLFAPSPTANLEIALDLSIAQSVLPHAQAVIQRSPALREELRSMLNRKFPRSMALVESLG